MFLNNATSSTKRTPVMGALNVAAIAPAIPHAIKILSQIFLFLFFGQQCSLWNHQVVP